MGQVRRGGSSTRSRPQLARPNGLLAGPPGAFFGPLPLGGHPLKANEVAEGKELRGHQKEEMGEEEEETAQKQELEYEDYITSCNKVRPIEKAERI